MTSSELYTVYSKNNCSYCDRAIYLIEDQGFQVQIKKIDENNCAFSLEFNGDLNPMIQMMVKTPLQSFINDLSINTAKLI